MLSCFKATELIEKSSVVKLSSFERIQLKLHLSVCDACKKYQIQSEVLDKALSNDSETAKLSDSELSKFEEDLSKRLNQK